MALLMMKHLVIKKIELQNGKQNPTDWEDFDEYAFIQIGIQDDPSQDKTYKIRVISLERIKTILAKEKGVYLRYCMVQQFFDMPAIERRIQVFLKGCMFETSPSKLFNFLSYYMDLID